MKKQIVAVIGASDADAKKFVTIPVATNMGFFTPSGGIYGTDIGCWVRWGSDHEALRSLITFDGSTNELVYDSTGRTETSTINLLEGITLDNSFEITVDIEPTAGFTTWDTPEGDTILIGLSNGEGTEGVDVRLHVKNDGLLYLGNYYRDGNNTIISADDVEYDISQGEFYLRIKQEDSDLSMAYKIGDAGEWVEFSMTGNAEIASGDFPNDISSYDSFTISFTDSSNANIATIYGFGTTGVSAKLGQPAFLRSSTASN